MRMNICVVLNSRNRKEALKELEETIDLFREDKHCNVEVEYMFPKYYIEKEYEAFKQRYRDLPEENIKSRLNDWGKFPNRFKDIEEYINYVLEAYGWETLAKYARSKYNIIRFEDDGKSICLYNPRGFIDYTQPQRFMRKYKNFSNKEIKDIGIGMLVLKDKSDIDWDLKKHYTDNEMIIKQRLNRDAKNNDYIAFVRVHYYYKLIYDTTNN